MTRLGIFVLGFLLVLAAAAPWISPQNPFELAQLDLNQADHRPAWMEPQGHWLLGTDAQGRDLVSLVLYGTRISLITACLSVALALCIGVPAGLLAGYAGGLADTVLMRLADVQLSFPVILIALAIDGLAGTILSAEGRESLMLPIVSLSIGLSQWAILARTVRAVTMKERGRAYVEAARIYGASRRAILGRHILPNTVGPVIVLAGLQLSSAVLAESTLSFLGAGLPPTTPSLGTLIRTGYEFLLAGRWWLTFFPGMALFVLGLSSNLAGDWLRDRLDPRHELRP